MSYVSRKVQRKLMINIESRQLKRTVPIWIYMRLTILDVCEGFGEA